MKNRWLLLWLGGLLVWLIGLVLCSAYDLSLSQHVYDRSALIARLVFYWGEVPAWICILASLALLIALGRGHMLAHQTFKPLAWAFVIQALALPLGLTQTLKLIWGRVRFIHLTANATNYTPFYIPAGPGEGMSFPSGHVAMAALPALIGFFLYQRGQTRLAWLAFGVCMGFSLLVSWGRIQSGSHYLTDCLFSIGVAWLVAPWVVRHSLKKFSQAETPLRNVIS